MKIQFGRMAVIRTAKSLKEKIEAGTKDGADKTQPELLHNLMGIYSARLFGLVFYRNDFGKHFQTTSIRDMMKAEREDVKNEWHRERSEICGRNLQLQENLETLREVNTNLQQKLKDEKKSKQNAIGSFFELIKAYQGEIAELKEKINQD